jgi:hypothetical protein
MVSDALREVTHGFYQDALHVGLHDKHLRRITVRTCYGRNKK